MPWSNQPIVAPVVVIGGSGSTPGLFVYNGTPASGNPPQFAAVASGVTTDPFGNAITSSKILVRGNIITESGGIFRTAATAPLIQLDGPHNAYLQYDSGIHLAASIAPVATSDGLGNTVVAGIASYGPGGLVGQLLNANLLIFTSGDNAPGLVSAGGGAMHVSSGKALLAQTVSTLQLLSSGGSATGTPQLVVATSGFPAPATTALLEVQGSQALKGIATPASPPAGNALMFSDTSGLLRMLAGLTGDTNAYGVARRVFTASGQLVNSLAAAAVTGITGITVAAATYLIRGMIIVDQGGTTANQGIQIAGPAISSMNIAWTSVEGGSVFSSGVQTALNTSLTTGNVPNGTTGTIHFDGEITFSASGSTFGLTAICLVLAADTWTLRAGSYLELMPV